MTGTARKQTTGATVSVIFTNVRETLMAIPHAVRLADRLGTEVRVLAVLEDAMVDSSYYERRLRALAAGQPITVRVEVIVCRDRAAAIAGALSPGEIVLIGRRLPSWWPGLVTPLVWRLRRAGHQVIVVGPNSPQAVPEVRRSEPRTTLAHTS